MLNAGLCQYENENENNTESSFNHIFSVVKCVESLAYFWGQFCSYDNLFHYILFLSLILTPRPRKNVDTEHIR